MPATQQDLPRYTRYLKNGKEYARCFVGGRDIHLGRYNSPESRSRYNQILAEWLASDRAPLPPKRRVVTVAHVVELFVNHIRNRYKTKTGRDTGTRKNYRAVIARLLKTYALMPAAEFGPRELKAFRHIMVREGCGRRHINEAASRVVSMFRYAASEELIDESTWRRLTTVQNLQPYETAAREPEPVPPVPDEIVDQTLPHLPPVVADMVRLQRLTGMRPCEVRMMRPCDIDRSGEVWHYRPLEHKTQHHGIDRVIALGPRAQEILLRYLVRAPESYCFSPADSERKRGRKPRATQGECYTKDAYRRAIARACSKIFPQPKGLQSAAEVKAWRRRHWWWPNQLRHTAATEWRRQFGLEAAQVGLGHRKANTTEIYAEKNLSLADEIARKLG